MSSPEPDARCFVHLIAWQVYLMLSAKGLMSHEYDNESLGSVTTKELFFF